MKDGMSKVPSREKSTQLGSGGLDKIAGHSQSTAVEERIGQAKEPPARPKVSTLVHAATASKSLQGVIASKG